MKINRDNNDKKEKKELLSISDFGVMYVGGEESRDSSGQTRIIKQAHVKYFMPQHKKYRTPVVMIPGFGLNSSIYEKTPDGRDGWAHFFLRKGFSVYLMDEPYSGLSGFDTTSIMAVKKGEKAVEALPGIIKWGMEESWQRWGFGPKVGFSHDHSKFPVQYSREFYKMVASVCIDDRFKGYGSPLKAEGIINLLKIIGPAIVISHSGSGLSCFDAIKINPELFEAIVTVEPVQVPTDADEIEHFYLKQNVLGIFGDYKEDRTLAGADMINKYHQLEHLVNKITEAKGQAKLIDLPSIGIKGNSHIMMCDFNNHSLAEFIMEWLKKDLGGLS